MQRATRTVYGTIQAILVSLTVLGIVGCNKERQGTRLECGTEPFTLAHVVTLGEGASSYSPTEFSRLAVDNAGRFLLAPTYSPGTIAVYNADGRLSGSWGKEGAGPGEFREIVDLATWGDSVIVADRRLSRVSILSMNGKFGRSFPVSGAINGILPLSRDSILVHATPFPGSGNGAFQVFTGAYVPALSISGPEKSARAGTSSFARIAAATPSALVAAQRTRYWFDIFARSGAHLGETRIAASWFKGFNPKRVLGVRGRQFSILQSAAGDTGTVIWTLSLRENALSNRFERQARAEQPTPATSLSLALQDSIFDYYLDHLDVRSGCSLYTVRYTTGVFKDVFSNRYVTTLRQVPSGNIVMDVWQITNARGNR